VEKEPSAKLMVLTLKLHFLTVKKQIGSMFCSLDAVLFFFVA
jgi:hypothetical protein